MLKMPFVPAINDLKKFPTQVAAMCVGLEPLHRIVGQTFTDTSHGEVLLLGQGAGGTDASPVVFCLAVLVCFQPNP